MNLTRRRYLGASAAAVALGVPERRNARSVWNSAPPDLADPPYVSWPAFRRDSANTGQVGDPDPVSSEVRRQWRFRTEASSVTQPVVENGRVFCLDSSGVLHALDPIDGDKLWEYEAGDPPDSPPIVHDGKVFFPVEGFTIHAVNADDGTRAWWKTVPDRIRTRLIGSDDGVRYVDNDGIVIILAPDTGEVSAKAHPSVPGVGRTYEREQVPPASSGNAFAMRYGKASAVILQGEDQHNALLEADETIVSGFSIAAGRCYFGTDRGATYGFDISSGEVSWEHLTGKVMPDPPAIADGSVYGTTTTGEAFAISQYGTVEWEVTVPAKVRHSPVVARGSVWVLDATGTLWKYDAETGEREGSVQVLQAPIVPAGLAAGQDAIFVGMKSGEIVGLYHPEALTVRKEMRELRATIRRNRDTIDVTEATNEYNDAVAEFESRSYSDATESVMDGLNSIEEVQKQRPRAREAIEILAREIATADANGLPTEEPKRLLDRARRALERAAFADAERFAREGLETLERTRQAEEDARQSIERLSNRIAEAEREEVQVRPARELLERANERYDRHEYAEAKRLAEEGFQRAEGIVAKASAANATIVELDDKLADVRDRGLKVPAARVPLDRARTAYDNAAYEKAKRLANEGLTTIETTVQKADAARDRIAELETRLHRLRGNGLKLPTAASRLEEAHDAYDRGEYEKATELAEDGLATAERTREEARIARKKIEQVERVNLPRFYIEFANLLDRDVLLRGAKREYDEGDYERARVLAERAERAEQIAFYGMDGAALSLLLLAYGLRRRGVDLGTIADQL